MAEEANEVEGKILKYYFGSSGILTLKAGTYRYAHGGVGTLNVYMNHRDFA